MTKQNDFYVTTFCNFAHDMSTGKPINHECYVIAPKLLAQERESDTWNPEDRDAWAKTRRIHRGIRRTL